jgi:type IV pilus assembly protein PilO|tara:strand:+ start:525 stop:1118 length:594 start_codon:yes stop_codon:yes gene_type:complete
VNFDLSQFDGLELKYIAQWPVAAKLLLSLFLCIMLLSMGYIFLISDKMDFLGKVSAEEETLKQQYASKYHVAANLELFEAQMIKAERIFVKQLKSLPNSHEIPGLLDDITFIGTTSGLDFVKLNWQPEVIKEIYIELPIDIEVIGSYHQFGKFVSEIAGLPRIVTLHDFQIAITQLSAHILRLKLQAKTYRYQKTEQ